MLILKLSLTQSTALYPKELLFMGSLCTFILRTCSVLEKNCYCLLTNYDSNKGSKNLKDCQHTHNEGNFVFLSYINFKH